MSGGYRQTRASAAWHVLTLGMMSVAGLTLNYVCRYDVCGGLTFKLNMPVTHTWVTFKLLMSVMGNFLKLLTSKVAKWLKDTKYTI